MSTQSVPQNSVHPEEDFPSIPESPLENSFLNPTWANGARGGVGVARRRIGVLIAALLAGEETHPVMTAENVRHTVRDELFELESILEAVEREMEREEKKATASVGKAE